MAGGHEIGCGHLYTTRWTTLSASPALEVRQGLRESTRCMKCWKCPTSRQCRLHPRWQVRCCSGLRTIASELQRASPSSGTPGTFLAPQVRKCVPVLHLEGARREDGWRVGRAPPTFGGRTVPYPCVAAIFCRRCSPAV